MLDVKIKKLTKGFEVSKRYEKTNKRNREFKSQGTINPELKAGKQTKK